MKIICNNANEMNSHKMEELTHCILQDRQHKEDCTARMWRSCHYKIIEKLRKFYKQSKTPVVKTGGYNLILHY
jgi:hypothetical protein